jgi:hypothetical protein
MVSSTPFMVGPPMFSLFFATILLLALGVHFLPTFIAVVRQHRHALLIFVLNLFLGWTVIGWLVLLIWAAVGEEKGEYLGDRRTVA